MGDENTQTIEQRSKLGLEEIRGLFYEGNLLYVPADPSLIADILHWFHDVPWCGHLLGNTGRDNGRIVLQRNNTEWVNQYGNQFRAIA